MLPLLDNVQQTLMFAGTVDKEMPSSGSAHKNRHLLISAVLLSLALFAWGLRYKTSLYHHIADFHFTQVSPAKLLSEAERCRDAQQAESSRQTKAAHPDASFFLLAQADLDKKISIERSPQPLQAEAPPRPRLVQRFYLRPPPDAFLAQSV